MHESILCGSSRFLPLEKRGLKTKESIHNGLLEIIPASLENEDVIFLCVGTNLLTGDSLGPLIGSYLKDHGYTNVVGSFDDPVHALNLNETIEKLTKGKRIIAIDASLGSRMDIGRFCIRMGAILPGKGVGKDLPAIGDYAISGCVNISGFMEYYVLQTTLKSTVVKMARELTSALCERFPLGETAEYARNEVTRSHSFVSNFVNKWKTGNGYKTRSPYGSRFE